MEVSGQLYNPAALPPGKISWYPLYRRVGERQSRSGRGGEKKNSQPLPGLEPPIIQSVASAILLSYAGSFYLDRYQSEQE
jgi:hypothetical protein